MAHPLQPIQKRPYSWATQVHVGSCDNNQYTRVHKSTQLEAITIDRSTELDRGTKIGDNIHGDTMLISHFEVTIQDLSHVCTAASSIHHCVDLWQIKALQAHS